MSHLLGEVYGKPIPAGSFSQVTRQYGDSMNQPKIICLTPVKNEAWILDRFLRCASLWADHIIVADQNSDDGSREIVQNYEKVILVDNEDPAEYDEYKMRKGLFTEARKIPGSKVLIALDADEVFTPNVLSSSQWKEALNAPPGTSLGFKLANLAPNLRQYWMPRGYAAIGYVDDGAEYNCGKIHTPRIHWSRNIPRHYVNEVAVMHYQYTDWDRMESKHRWYKCWEKVNNPRRSAVGIYRQYHHMYSIGPKDLNLIPSWWFENYERIGIDMTNIDREKTFRWDQRILEYFAEHGTKTFSKLDIWDVDWDKAARLNNLDHSDSLHDPRSRLEVLIHHWLWATQPRASSYFVRLQDILLRLLSLTKW